MFKIPLEVVQIDERQRRGEPHILQLTLAETNEDDRMYVGENLTINLQIRPQGDNNPENGFDRNRFKPGDVWYLVMKEDKKHQSEPPATPENE